MTECDKITIHCQSKDGEPIRKAIENIISIIDSEKLNIDNNIRIHLIIQNDAETLSPCRGLYVNNETENIKDEIKYLRYVFIRTEEKQRDNSFSFWEEVLCNIGIAKTFDLKCSNILSVLYSIINEVDEINIDHVTAVVNGFSCINKYFKEIFKEKFIDEIDRRDKLLHGTDKETTNGKKVLFYAYFVDAVFDWSKQNKWILANGNSDEYKGDFHLLILDDLMWAKPGWPNDTDKREKDFKDDLESCSQIANILSGSKWEFSYAIKPCNYNKNFKTYVQEEILSSKKIECRQLNGKKVAKPLALADFTHILADWMLDESGQYSGFHLVRELKTWIERNLKISQVHSKKESAKEQQAGAGAEATGEDPSAGEQPSDEKDDKKKKEITIPEILILSRNSDPVTIQSALDAGASGYILKDYIAELPLIVGRAGKPLKVEEANEINKLLTENFPSLRSFPAFVPKSLYFDKWKKLKRFTPPNKENEGTINCEKDSIAKMHKEFLNKIPKSDLHVHFGPAIPIHICYDLAFISAYRWYLQIEKETKEKTKGETKGENKHQLVKAAKLISEILVETIKEFKVNKNKASNEDEFRNCYMNSFRTITGIYEVTTVNNTIKYLDKKFNKLTENQIACLVVAGLGIHFGIYSSTILNERIKEIKDICSVIADIQKEKINRDSLLSFYLQDTSKIIGAIKGLYTNENADNILIKVKQLFKFEKKLIKNTNVNPLSSLLSISDVLQINPQGLPKYLGASDLIGASLLQFVETLLLASFHIPTWAAKENVWHQELRAGPKGFLNELGNNVLSTKIMLLGLYAGIKNVKKDKDNKNKHLTTSVLITAKRHKGKKDIEESALLATEFITRNEICAKNSESQTFIPKVIGMDLAGIERGNLPDDLVEHFRESFKRCLMMTIHAGEDESVESIWQAVYSLHASRVGHGLKLDDYLDLKRLFKDRQLCVELCPKSNQYTNGYIFEEKDSNNKQNRYVFQNYKEYGIPVTINTDNPLLSHRTNDREMNYPLSEEYLVIPHLVYGNSDKKGGNTEKPYINSLLVLHLIYNSFKHSFLSPEDKACLIACADKEVFNTLAKEYLDVCISA